MDKLAIGLNALRLIFGLIAIVSNSCIVICVIRSRPLRRPRNVLIANLSLTDILNGLTNILGASMTFVDCISLPGSTSSEFRGLLSLFPFVANNVAIPLIAAERFFCIYSELRYKSIVTVPRVVYLLVVVWILTAVLCFTPPIHVIQRIILPVILTICVLSVITLDAYVAYVACVKSKQDILRLSGLEGTPLAAELVRTRWRTTTVMALVLGVYLGTMVPVVLVIAGSPHALHSCGPADPVMLVAVLFWGVNNCISPILLRLRI